MPSPIADERLVAASLDGDEEAFAALVSRHAGRARAVALAHVRRPEEADDVVQEAVLAAFLGLRRLRDPRRFSSWLCAIAANLAKMRLRRDRVARSLGDVSGGALVPEGVDLRLDAEDDLEALDVLPAGEREAVVLHYVDGFSCDEIAARLGRSPGAVRVRLHRARRRLRAHLGIHLTPRKELGMIEVVPENVVVRMVEDESRLASERLRIVVLREKDGDRRLPIWIGAAEGDALALHLGGDALPRPLTIDLAGRLVEAAGARVEDVRISALREKTFYAVVRLAVGDRVEEVDARPSDALNLAVRVGAPVFVDDEVMEQAGRRPDNLEAEFDSYPLEEERPPGVWRPLSAELVKSLYPAP